MKNIGIDIGGMSIKSGIVDEDGKIIVSHNIKTEVQKGFDVISKNMVHMINELIKKSDFDINDIQNIGIGIPGVADENGKVHYATNLFWTNEFLGQVLRDNFKNQNIFIENDATVACVAEQKFGSIQGLDNAIMLTLGTGVGSGIILNGKKYSGNLGIGSEIGHIIIGENFYNCSCGNNGCFETFCSATAIIKYTQKLLKEENNSILKDILLDDVTAKMVFDGYIQNDKLCKQVVDRFLAYLSSALASLINIFSPQAIVLGGGVSGAYDIYIDKLNTLVKQKILFKNLPYAKIVKATLGNDAGIVGASLLS